MNVPSSLSVAFGTLRNSTPTLSSSRRTTRASIFADAVLAELELEADVLAVDELVGVEEPGAGERQVGGAIGQAGAVGAGDVDRAGDREPERPAALLEAPGLGDGEHRAVALDVDRAGQRDHADGMREHDLGGARGGARVDQLEADRRVVDVEHGRERVVRAHAQADAVGGGGSGIRT